MKMPVAEVQEPEREHRRHEREAETVHPAEQRPVEREPELLSPVGDEANPDDERAGEVADDHAGSAPVEADDEEDGRGDGDHEVDEGRERERHGALLRAEERRQLLVVHLHPKQDKGRAHERRVVGRVEEPLRDRRGDAMPTTSPIVAIPIVNQKEVRTTRSLCAGSGESK